MKLIVPFCFKVTKLKYEHFKWLGDVQVARINHLLRIKSNGSDPISISHNPSVVLICSSESTSFLVSLPSSLLLITFILNTMLKQKKNYFPQDS